MHDARSGNSSEDESPVPGDYRTGCPKGGRDHNGGVVDIRHTCGGVYSGQLIYSEQLSCSK